jgi:hypothetical protein
MGILILGIAGIYLLISSVIVLSAIRYARRNGLSAKRWGWGAALVMWLIPFWDWLPTVVVHQYYCATEPGFWVYKTLGQWNKENPGVMEGLHPKLSIQHTADGSRHILLDERFSIETHYRKPISFLITTITDRLMVDTKTKEALAKQVNVGSNVGNLSTGGGYKFWLSLKPCGPDRIFELSKEIDNMRVIKRNRQQRGKK